MHRRDRTIDFVELPVRSAGDVAHAKKFYADVFGWTWQDWGDDYADTRSSGVGAGLNADRTHRPRHPLAVIYVADLDVAQCAVLVAGGKLTRATFSFPGGRRFHFADPADNELAVWSDQ